MTSGQNHNHKMPLPSTVPQVHYMCIVCTFMIHNISSRLMSTNEYPLTGIKNTKRLLVLYTSFVFSDFRCWTICQCIGPRLLINNFVNLTGPFQFSCCFIFVEQHIHEWNSETLVCLSQAHGRKTATENFGEYETGQSCCNWSHNSH